VGTDVFAVVTTVAVGVTATVVFPGVAVVVGAAVVTCVVATVVVGAAVVVSVVVMVGTAVIVSVAAMVVVGAAVVACVVVLSALTGSNISSIKRNTAIGMKDDPFPRDIDNPQPAGFPFVFL
jgi:hypothetical protein